MRAVTVVSCDAAPVVRDDLPARRGPDSAQASVPTRFVTLNLLGARRRHPPSDVARFGGTTVTMLEQTYAHLLESSADLARQRLDAFSARWPKSGP